MKCERKILPLSLNSALFRAKRIRKLEKPNVCISLLFPFPSFGLFLFLSRLSMVKEVGGSYDSSDQFTCSCYLFLLVFCASALLFSYFPTYSNLSVLHPIRLWLGLWKLLQDFQKMDPQNWPTSHKRIHCDFNSVHLQKSNKKIILKFRDTKKSHGLRKRARRYCENLYTYKFVFNHLHIKGDIN